MSNGSRYRSTIVLSEPLKESIDRLYAHPYTVASMRFNRRSSEPIKVTDAMHAQMQDDGMQLYDRGVIASHYIQRIDWEAYTIYQDRDTHLSESDPQTEQELLDCILILSLRELIVEVDFETFCRLRIRPPGFFENYGWESDDGDGDDFLYEF